MKPGTMEVDYIEDSTSQQEDEGQDEQQKSRTTYDQKPITEQKEKENSTSKGQQNRIEAIDIVKKKGNDAFANKNYSEAQKQYENGLRFIGMLFKGEEKNLAASFKRDFQLNLALTHLKKGETGECLMYAESVLNDDKGNVKAHFRKAQAFHEMANYAKAKAECQEILEKLDPSFENATILMKRIHKDEADSKKRENKMFSKAFTKLNDSSSTSEEASSSNSGLYNNEDLAERNKKMAEEEKRREDIVKTIQKLNETKLDTDNAGDDDNVVIEDLPADVQERLQQPRRSLIDAEGNVDNENADNADNDLDEPEWDDWRFYIKLFKNWKFLVVLGIALLTIIGIALYTYFKIKAFIDLSKRFALFYHFLSKILSIF